MRRRASWPDPAIALDGPAVPIYAVSGLHKQQWLDAEHAAKRRRLSLCPAVDSKGNGDVCTVDDTGARAERPDGGTSGDPSSAGDGGGQPDAPTSRPPPHPTSRRPGLGQPPAVAICDRLAQTFEIVLDSEEKTNRAARLLSLVLLALVAIVVGTAVVFGLMVISAPWWALASAGLTAVGGGGALVWRRRRPASVELPEPRAPS